MDIETPHSDGVSGVTGASFMHPTYSNPHNKLAHVREQEIERLGGRCPICHDPASLNGTGLRFVLDHDHNTGKTRGLICDRCNRAMHRDVTPDHLRAMANYLERHAEHGFATRVVPKRAGRPAKGASSRSAEDFRAIDTLARHRASFPDQYTDEELAMPAPDLYDIVTAS